MRASLSLILFFLVSISSGCSGCLGPSVPDGKILVLNDSQDSEYNVVKISGGGENVALNPGEYKILPKGTTSINFSRAYKDHVKYYKVVCPKSLSSGIRIKLIDVHTNRLPGGCNTVDAGRR